MNAQPLRLEFEDAALLVELCGRHDQNLQLVEERLGVQLIPRGNQIAVLGNETQCERAQSVLEDLYGLIEKGLPVGPAQVLAALRVTEGALLSTGEEKKNRASDFINPASLIETPQKKIVPRSKTQHAYVSALRSHELVFGIGPAGTGKTYLPVAYAVSLLMQKKIDKIILSRPVVEAGESLGFLPGTLEEKVDPYLRPLFDALQETLGAEMAGKLREKGTIEVAPLAYMRGRTIERAVMILDEAQNTTVGQIKMFLTRMGEGSRMIITGDISQCDLPRNVTSGLRDAVNVLDGLPDISIIKFTDADVVRHPLVGKIVRAYEEREKQFRMPLNEQK